LAQRLVLPPINSSEATDLFSALESSSLLEIRSHGRGRASGRGDGLIFLRVQFGDITFALAGECKIDQGDFYFGTGCGPSHLELEAAYKNGDPRQRFFAQLLLQEDSELIE
jgi:hypothetical protein